jgi:hypothetical protein
MLDLKAKTVELILIISLAAFLIVFPAPAKAQTPNRMLASPSLLAPNWGESHLNFTVEIKIEMFDFMDSYQAYLLWNPALFKVSHGETFSFAKGNKTIVDGGFLKNGTSNYATFFSGTVNNTAGVMSIFSAQQTGDPFVTSVTGNGTLFNVIFEARGTGQCPLHLNNTQIMQGQFVTVLHTTADGYFNNQQYPITAPDMSTHDIFIESSSTVTDFGFSLTENRTYFNVTGLTSTIGYLNVTIPKDLLDADPGIPPFDWIILLDNAPVASFTKTTNDTHTFIYFDYAHSQHNVQIKGNKVIPEYPIALISLISLAIFTSLVLLTKRFSTILKPRSRALKLK